MHYKNSKKHIYVKNVNVGFYSKQWMGLCDVSSRNFDNATPLLLVVIHLGPSKHR